MIVFNFFNDSKETVMTNFLEYFGIAIEDFITYIEEKNCDEITVYDMVNNFSLNLNDYDSSQLSIVCRHMTTSSEEGIESFKINGIINLIEMLENETILKRLLNDNEIHIDIKKKTITISDKQFPILSSSDECKNCYNKNGEYCSKVTKCELFDAISKLYNKLYYYDGTVESFINASVKEMKRYSSIRRYPEILCTIEEILSSVEARRVSKLSDCWMADNAECYVLEYKAALSDMQTLEKHNINNLPTGMGWCLEDCGYTIEDHYEERVKKRFYDNFYFIKIFISIYFYNLETYSSLLPNKNVSANSILYYKVVNDEMVIMD